MSWETFAVAPSERKERKEKKAKAAKLLGISERSMWYRVKKYEIET